MAELALAQVEVKIGQGYYLGIYEDKKITLPQFAKEYLSYADANKSSGAAARDRVSTEVLISGLPRLSFGDYTQGYRGV